MSDVCNDMSCSEGGHENVKGEVKVEQKCSVLHIRVGSGSLGWRIWKLITNTYFSGLMNLNPT